MRLLFFMIAATVIATWYAWFFIRPERPDTAKQVFMVTGTLGVLILAAFVRLI